MIQFCKNCGAKIVFDPKTNCMYCDNCGSFFDVSEYQIEEGYQEDAPVPQSQLYGDYANPPAYGGGQQQAYGSQQYGGQQYGQQQAYGSQQTYGSGQQYGSQQTYDTQQQYAGQQGYTDQQAYAPPDMECYIYRCGSCGAEISINNVEASTFCVYCGNPNVVFSRVAKVKRPQKIIPFSVTWQQAEMLIRAKVRDGFFIPNEIKNFRVEMLRGIYIPYYITCIGYRDAMEVKSTVKRGKNSETIYSLRSGYCVFDRMTTDASRRLTDATSEKLEPFNMQELKDFNENYLTGFYADVSDVDPQEACVTAYWRARGLFEEEILKSVEGSSKKILQQYPEYIVQTEPMKTMFPAWFLTFRYKDRPYTILVNGQTGKVVGGIPWNKTKFITLFLIIAVLLSIILIPILKGYFILEFGSGRRYSSSSNDSSGKLLVYIVIGAGLAISAGVTKLKRVLKSIRLASESSLTSFVSKRQKGG